jgi:type VI secretion system secreted protein VgrG
MAAATATRPVSVTTPLGPDVLLLVGFKGHEGLSELFSFELNLLAESRKEIAFDKLLGQSITIQLALAGGKTRPFSGICKRISQGEQDGTFTSYRMEIVPQFWLLTKRSQSRIFQHLSVPDILKKVLDGLDVTSEIQGTFQPRDYCVQYRESDFDFASRLMEEEGIYYFFKHSDGGHKMVLANTPASHPDMPSHAKIIFETMTAGNALEDRIFTWEKAQELRSGKVTLWDHSFELPHKHLEADQAIQDSVSVGKATHKLKVAGNDKLEIYDFPGAYAQRFDGIDKGGGEQAAELQKIFQDNKRTVGLRMQQEAVEGLTIGGTSSCRHLVSGHKFALERHYNGDGSYVVTRVEHTGKSVEYRSNDGEAFHYQNTFTCIPLAVPYRPQRTTPKPTVLGSQTAVVVGPAGEEIFCDKYGRVKVQFHWDREGKYNADSSCWIRVSTIWAGKGWGITNVPRIGHEVIVDFMEGDPDQPIIIGSVHNADHMPTGSLPKEKMVSGLKSNSTPGGGGYNGLVFNDTKGKEKISLHGQYDMDTKIEHDDTQHVVNNRKINVDGTFDETIKGNTTIKISEGTYSHDVAAKTADYHVLAKLTEKYDDNQETKVAGDLTITVGGKGGHITISATEEITLVTGASKLNMKKDGSIELSGKNLAIKGSESVNIGGNSITSEATADNNTKGAIVLSSATGNNTVRGAMVMLNP